MYKIIGMIIVSLTLSAEISACEMVQLVKIGSTYLEPVPNDYTIPNVFLNGELCDTANPSAPMKRLLELEAFYIENDIDKTIIKCYWIDFKNNRKWFCELNV